MLRNIAETSSQIDVWHCGVRIGRKNAVRSYPILSFGIAAFYCWFDGPNIHHAKVWMVPNRRRVHILEIRVISFFTIIKDLWSQVFIDLLRFQRTWIQPFCVSEAMLINSLYIAHDIFGHWTQGSKLGKARDRYYWFDILPRGVLYYTQTCATTHWQEGIDYWTASIISS